MKKIIFIFLISLVACDGWVIPDPAFKNGQYVINKLTGHKGMIVDAHCYAWDDGGCNYEVQFTLQGWAIKKEFELEAL